MCKTSCGFYASEANYTGVSRSQCVARYLFVCPAWAASPKWAKSYRADAGSLENQRSNTRLRGSSAAIHRDRRAAPPLCRSPYCFETTVKKKSIKLGHCFKQGFPLEAAPLVLQIKRWAVPGRDLNRLVSHTPPALQGLCPNCLYSCLDKHLLCEVSGPLTAFPLSAPPEFVARTSAWSKTGVGRDIWRGGAGWRWLYQWSAYPSKWSGQWGVKRIAVIPFQ